MSVSNPCALRRHEGCQLPECSCRCHNRTGTGVRLGPSHKPDLTFEWEDVPDKKKSTYPIAERLRESVEMLRTEPKRWARLCVYTSKTGAGGAQGKLRKSYPGFEFTTRKVDDDKTAVYGRFVDAPDWDDTPERGDTR